MSINWDRPEKGIARDFAIGFDGVAYKSYFCMPSHSCLDLKRGLEQGSIRRTTQVVCVDGNPDNWKKIENFLKKNFKSYIFFKGKIRDFPISKMMQEKKFSKFDFAFFDLCGHLNAHITHWLYKNRECFSDSCRFGMTVAAPDRIKIWENVVHKAAIDMEYDGELEELLGESINNLAKDVVGLPIDVDTPKHVIRKKHSIYATNVIRSIKASCYAFMIAMNNKNMAINRLYRYKESNEDGKRHIEMVFVDFRFDGVLDGDDYCIDLLKEFDTKVGYNYQVLRYGRTKKDRKEYTVKPVSLKTAYDIARYMGIFGAVESIDELPQGRKSWITINAKRAGLDPEKVMEKIEKRLQKDGLQAA